MASSNGGHAASYVGADWLLYVDSSGDYDESEVVAPCLMLAQPGSTLRVRGRDRQSVQAEALLHAPGWASTGEADGGAAFLYFDPVSDAGRAAAGLCEAASGKPWPVPERCGWSPEWFARLLSGTAPRAEVAHWVDTARAGLVAHCAGGDRVDWRMRQVADTLHGDLAGRLSVEHLAERVHWSPEHLRKVFRVMAGMTLSRYQMWCRLHRVVDGICAPRNDAEGFTAESSLLDAGFYDVPHGSRAVRRYFGLSARSALQPGIHRRDCRGT